jgi:hypothetical protein
MENLFDTEAGGRSFQSSQFRRYPLLICLRPFKRHEFKADFSAKWQACAAIARRSGADFGPSAPMLLAGTVLQDDFRSVTHQRTNG